MSSWYWLYSYISAFWATVVVNCAQPSNWNYCWPPDWLIQGVRDYMHVRSTPPYSEERKILQSMERTNGLE
jgi:negative regulator of sigma E activity|tara:strand:+ start:163 stop:375 length:213 start_codon:yes stop_codon:yes gene_type:complete